MYPGSYYSHTSPMPPYYYAPNDNDPKHKDTPSHMKMDRNPLNSPYHQPWPYAPSYCYPYPLDYHSCCNHGYFGGGPYGFRPPYPNYQPPPPPPAFHSYGFYPPFPGAYSIPPPHYSVEQPKYDYDKSKHSPRHCCGCKHQEDEKKSSIEKEEREADKKTSESLVPFFLKNCPYPIMWVPPEYMNAESKATEKEKYSHEPVSLKTLEPAKREGNREIDRDQQSGDGGHGAPFPFPLFWLPSNKNEVGNDMKGNNVDLVAHNGLTAEKKKQTTKNDEAEYEASGKHVVQKVIPGKQVGTDEEKKTPKRIETKAKSDSVENTANGTEVKASPKASKLPPVCLRIDPLPKKKNTSRSPSPPGDKERSRGPSVNDPKSSQQHTHMSDSPKNNLEKQSKGKIKTIEVTNAANNVEKDGLGDHADNVSMKKGNESRKGVLQGQSSEGVICDAKEKKKLSEYEAASIIQSVYRGFEMRKSQPLLKLRQISEVKKQVVELRNRIQDLESSSTTSANDKQKLIIGETIMSLLLKLDTIQGLHPTVRDARKSVAKELVGLQEKLDSLTFEKPETPIEENISSAEQVVHTKDDVIQEESDQGHAQSDNDVKLVESDSVLCENHEMQVIDPQDHDGAEGQITQFEPQEELYNEEIEQPVNDVIQEKFDQALTQSDSIDGIESKEIVDNCGAEAHDTKLVEQSMNTAEFQNDQLQMSGEGEKSVEDVIQEKSNQAQVKSDNNVEAVESESDKNHEVETTDFKDDVGTEPGDMTHETLVETKSQWSIENLESEQQVDQEKPDQIEATFETDIENVDSCEHPELEAIESQDEGDVQTHNIDASMVEIKAELPREDAVNAIQEDFVVSTEEAPKADDVDSSTEILVEDLGRVPSLSLTSGGDKRLMEENEKLRAVTEELMKAGNEQLSVIKELTGRVKDLEKKLSRNKKKVRVNNKCRSRGRCIVQEELSDCIV